MDWFNFDLYVFENFKFQSDYVIKRNTYCINVLSYLVVIKQILFKET